MQEIIFYRTLNGKAPVTDFLDSLSGKQAQKVAWILEMFEETKIISDQYFKKLKGADNIWEIRVAYSGNIYRILGFIESGNFILTNGFVKKTQRIPKREIKIAEAREKNYFERLEK